MPFEMQVSDVTYGDGEMNLVGRLVSGVYSGPETLAITGQDGSQWTTQISSHGMEGDNLDWPVRPEHNTRLRLTICRPDEPFELDLDTPVVGRGTVGPVSEDRVDASDQLMTSAFWGMMLDGLQDEEGEHQAHWLETTSEAVNSCWEDFMRHVEHGSPVFLRLPLVDDLYLEFEFAAEGEHQIRYWLGDDGQRVLMGYQSGHFSLPAFRFVEIAAIAKHLSPELRPAAVLLLPGSYSTSHSAEMREPILSWVQSVPFAKAHAEKITDTLLEQSVVEDAYWQHDTKLGWTASWMYSQRKPKGNWSVLSDDDFAFIQGFFEKLGVSPDARIREAGDLAEGETPPQPDERVPEAVVIKASPKKPWWKFW